VPAAPSTTQAWEAEWNKWVAAAKQEGKVSVSFLNSGPGFRKVGDAFEEAYPGIKADINTAGASAAWYPQLVGERSAGIYNYDVAQLWPDVLESILLPANVLTPVRPSLIRPEVTDDKGWINGYPFGFTDLDKKLGYGYTWRGSGGIWINTDTVNKDDLKDANALLDPKWKGQIISVDPRSGASYIIATAIRLNYGEDVMKKIWIDQETVLSRDLRQACEQMVRGTYPLGFGLNESALKEFQDQGLGLNIKRYLLPGASYVTMESIWLMNKAPHPNAANVFLNWFLSKEGQTVHSQDVGYNSRRTDVPVHDENAIYPLKDPDADYEAAKISGSVEVPEAQNELPKTQEIFRQLLG
jgi:iron(III) transport system substrate-binding protein